MTSNDRARQDLNRMLTQWGAVYGVEYPVLVTSEGGGRKRTSSTTQNIRLFIYNRDLRESISGDNGTPPQHTTEFVAALASAPADNGELTWESKRWRIVDCTKYGPLEDPIGYHGFLREIPKNG